MKHLVVSDHIHGLLRVKAAEEGITINELVSRELYQKIEVVKTEPIQLKNKEIKPQDRRPKKRTVVVPNVEEYHLPTSISDEPEEDETPQYAILRHSTTGKTKKFLLQDVESDLEETYCIHDHLLVAACVECGRQAWVKK